MPQTKYLRLTIDNSVLDLTDAEALPITISYQLESREDYSRKQSSRAFDIDVPATTNNDKIFNTYHNAGILDLTPLGTYRRIRSCNLSANGSELLIGKAFLKKSAKQGNVPAGYKLNCYGNNADWMIDMKETTLYDILSTCVAGGPFSFTYSKAYIESTWDFDGTDETMPMVFAPAKYNGWMDPVAQNDDNYAIETMRPSISPYFILYWGFKSLGYKIDSFFMDQFYFRQLVMPWTWGNFLDTENSKYDIHKFSAWSAENPLDADGWKHTQPRGSMFALQNGFFDTRVTNVRNNNGAGDYTWDATNKAMEWTYNTPDYSLLKILFSLNISLKCNVTGTGSRIFIEVRWLLNGTLKKQETIMALAGGMFGGTNFQNATGTIYFEETVALADVVTAEIWYEGIISSGIGAEANTTIKVNEFKIETIKIPIGATILMDTYLQFKNYKFLDLLAGLVDCFDWTINTNPINKVVTIEPTHDYYLFDDPTNTFQGFFKDWLNWTQKADPSITEDMELFSDYEREVYYKFKDDGQDGGLKQIQDRAQTTVAMGKYVFTDRFKAGKKEHENRFFAPVCHYDVQEFKHVNGVAPQFIAILAENVANRSRDQAENTFLPKLAFYHGLEDDITDLGGWTWDGNDVSFLPFMYAVNYKPGGEVNPVLSYSDENINGVVANGLMKRYFLNRLAIMRNGNWLTKAFKINNRDLENYIHREFIRLNDDKWELLEIQGYSPLNDDSTLCLMRKYWPVSQDDGNSCYPSWQTGKSILSGVMLDEFDTKYERLMRLPTDK